MNKNETLDAVENRYEVFINRTVSLKQLAAVAIIAARKAGANFTDWDTANKEYRQLEVHFKKSSKEKK